ncbi:MAG: bifunctional UDP-N-acetylglucosamine diphosphorylase/glucosamine-1-phosphate N-acetyltransferase GlmU [Acidobacteriota bacterium]|nr:bifunctional UDP-N-acetylglucosamine diphosphorylase/glucosamine-1-phosphate N-acetyltransferase GlmU [Acidobacteriota bacterium]
MAALACVVLAAGEGKRFNSKFPKPLQRLCGRTLMDHVLAPLESLEPDRIVIVVGSGREQIYEVLRDRRLEFAVQEEPLGTGHAALCAEDLLRDFEGTMLVTCADIPLVSRATLQRLVDAHRARRATATILTANMADPTGYGRIVRSRDGRVRAIVEHRDATDEIRQIQEINAGIYCFDARRAFEELHQVKPDNVQGEYYLPDVIARLVAGGDVVTAVLAENSREVIGINTREHLAQAEQIARDRARMALLESGVTLMDPATVYADEGVRAGRDTIIGPGVLLLGDTVIGEDCEIGPYAQLRNCKVGNGVKVFQGAVVTDSVIADHSIVGPYCNIRSNSEVGAGSHVGSFVEVVRGKLGPGVKNLHFVYLGDAEIKAGVNIGAGTITCNYDGVNKHHTVIEENAFIGSDSVLIAPVNIGEGAFVAAGSVITDDVPPGGLGIARGRQSNKESWTHPALRPQDEEQEPES